jgi:hypothetical protein
MKSRGAEHAQRSHSKTRAPRLKRGWIAALCAWGIAGVYPACSDAEFKVSAQAGTAGSAGNAGGSGRDASEGDGDADASGGRGGSSGSSSGGTAGTPSDAQPDSADAQPDAPEDAPPDAPRDGPVDAPTDSRPACDAPLQYFLDADHDTYGADDSMVRACAAPGSDWVLRGGDCRDDLPEVRPNQNDYKPEGYETKSGVSFDYNCSGIEEPDPGSFGAAPTSCPLLTPCGGPGYVPGPRSGPGVNALCGSLLLRGCVTNGLGCMQQQTATTSAKRCR